MNIFEAWKRFSIKELNRNDIIKKANSHGGSSSSPEHSSKPPFIPFIGHNYRAKNEIEDGTIKFTEITDGGVMSWTIVPFDPKRKAKYGVYEIALKFENWGPIVSDFESSTKDKTLNLLKNAETQTDNIKFHCNCPSYQYHYNDVANTQGVAIQPTKMSPGQGKTGRLANPGRAGIACKHIRRIVEVFPSYYAEIYKKINELVNQ